jgi:germination protein M
MKALYELQGAGLSDNELEIKEVNLKDKIAYVTFNEGYKNWEPGKQILVRGSLVYSLTALDFIEGVNFFIEDNPLTTANGDVVETLSRTDFLVNALNPKPPTNTQVITLYFGKEGGTGLYAEKRAIQFNNNIPIERYILEELIKGPQTEGLINLVPSDTKINALQVQDTVCQIDISYDAKSKPGVSLVNDRLAVYAIVNSLTESSKVQKVSFLVDGKKPVDIIGNIDFNTLFERDETLIEKNQTTTGS